MRNVARLLEIVAVSGLMAASARSEEPPALPAAPDFAARDLAGETRTLGDFKGKFLVLEWTNFDCPFVKKHYASGNLPALQKTYMEKGVAWVLVCSSAPGKQGHGTAEEWRERLAKAGCAPTAMLLDPEGKLGRLYGAKTTPHIFIVNPEGRFVYRGAVDDQPSFDPATLEKARNYVRAALDAALAGRPIETAETTAYGCSVKY